MGDYFEIIVICVMIIGSILNIYSIITANECTERVKIQNRKMEEFARAVDCGKMHKSRGPCVHGDVCRAYMNEKQCILRMGCPTTCEFYEPKEK